MDNSLDKFDPVVEATMNHIRASLSDNSSTKPNLHQIKDLVFLIVDQPSRFDSLSKEINDIYPCDSAMDFLRNVLATEKKAPPPPVEVYDTFDSARKRTRSWTQNEDYRLIMGVHLCGDNNWSEVSEFVGGGRTRSQCSQRWCRVIDPRISKDHWSEQEEKKLLEVVKKVGDKSWIKVAAEMNGRSDVQCRYKYRKLMKERMMSSSNYSSSSTSTTGMTSPAPKQPMATPALAQSPYSPVQQQYIQNDEQSYNMFNQQTIQYALMNYFANQTPHPAISASAPIEQKETENHSNTSEMKHQETVHQENAYVLPKFDCDQIFEAPLDLDSDKSLFDSQSLFNTTIWLDF